MWLHPTPNFAVPGSCWCPSRKRLCRARTEQGGALGKIRKTTENAQRTAWVSATNRLKQALSKEIQ